MDAADAADDGERGRGGGETGRGGAQTRAARAQERADAVEEVVEAVRLGATAAAESESAVAKRIGDDEGARDGVGDLRGGGDWEIVGGGDRGV